jgi:beta-xylosidase
MIRQDRWTAGAAITVLVTALLAGAAGRAATPPSAGPSGSLAGTFTNPVLGGDFPDPGVMRTDDAWYAYATGDLTVNIQVARSTDLVTWERLGEALPRLPFWQPSARGSTWAPEVWRTSAGYVMSYTARDALSGRQCLALAVATSPEGPFVDDSDAPFLCQVDLGGSIDPFPFQDADGSRHLLWKNDGNCCGQPTRLWMAPLSDDGLALIGEPVDLGLGADQPWEGALIEAPTLLLEDDTYLLLYSANAYDSDRYAVGVATATSLHGPYTDVPGNPILASDDEAAGPGGQAVVTDADGDPWLLYHAWDPAAVGSRLGGVRTMWLDELLIEGDRVTVDGPDAGPQAVP